MRIKMAEENIEKEEKKKKKKHRDPRRTIVRIIALIMEIFKNSVLYCHKN